MKQKLIFLDIDGTLLPPGEMLIPQSTVEALHKAHANGHKLFLCTGRNLRMTQPLLDYGFDGAVCSAGGYVFCGDKVLVDLPMEPQLAQGVRSAMERHGVECTLEARDATYGLSLIHIWRCTSAWAHPACAICSIRPKRPCPASSLSMRSMLWVVSAAQVWAAVTMSASRP